MLPALCSYCEMWIIWTASVINEASTHHVCGNVATDILRLLLHCQVYLCSALNEKRVDIFHSALRSRIRKTARSITRSKFEGDGFERTYVPQYLQ